MLNIICWKFKTNAYNWHQKTKILICFSAIINQIDRWKESDDSWSDNQVVALLDSLLFINQFCQTRVENFKTPIIFWVYDLHPVSINYPFVYNQLAQLQLTKWPQLAFSADTNPNTNRYRLLKPPMLMGL